MGDKELLAWPGARRFEDADPSSFQDSLRSQCRGERNK